MRTKLKNFITGNIVDKTFRGGENVDSATVEKRETQFSYVDGDEVGPLFFTPAETDRASGGFFYCGTKGDAVQPCEGPMALV